MLNINTAVKTRIIDQTDEVFEDLDLGNSVFEFEIKSIPTSVKKRIDRECGTKKGLDVYMLMKKQLKECLVGWKGIADNGKEIPFSEQAVDNFYEHNSELAAAIVVASHKLTIPEAKLAKN